MPSPPPPRFQASTSGPFLACKLGSRRHPSYAVGAVTDHAVLLRKEHFAFPRRVPWPVAGSPCPVGADRDTLGEFCRGRRAPHAICLRWTAALARSRKIGTILSEPIGHTRVADGSPLSPHFPSLATFHGIMVLLFMGTLKFGV